jgi:adenylate cyclase
MAPAPKRPERRASIAVLAFDNRSGDPEQEFFSDGISEDIITDLSKARGLTVIARNSSFAYKGRAVDPREIGRDLGVTSVLEGSVRRAGGRVRITAQLIDAETGTHLWADRYDRDLADLFAVQDDVTHRIVDALKIRLFPSEQSGMSGAGTANVEAHEQFMRLRGKLLVPGLTAEQWREAMAAGERAVALDPGYAEAYALLGIMQVLDFHNQWSGRPAKAALAVARGYADRALELAPEGVLPNHAAAVTAFWARDLARAEACVGKVLAAAPDYALALFTRGEVAMSRGRFSAAIPDFERATRLDPAARHFYLQFLAMSHFLEGHFETAVLMFRDRVALDPNTDIGRAWLASALGHVGAVDEARRIWAELQEINPQFDVETRLGRLPFTNASGLERVLEGLRAAGLAGGR